MRTTLLHKYTLLNALFLNLMHPILLFVLFQHPPTKHLLQPALLLALLQLHRVRERRVVGRVHADFAAEVVLIHAHLARGGVVGALVANVAAAAVWCEVAR